MNNNDDFKISYSAWGKYMQCPKLYDYHYNQRLRPCGKNSSLVFGSAMDGGLNTLLLTRDFNKALEEFRNLFRPEDVKDVEFDYRDFDARLLDIKDITNNKNESAWKSMRVKGRLLLEAYYNEIFPLIEQVEYVQKRLHSRPGFLDAIVRIRGYGRVLLDHKTSSRPYDNNIIKSDTQLALYAKDQGIEKAGFAVLIKEIDTQTIKTCTKCGFVATSGRHETCSNTKDGKRCYGTWEEKHNPRAKTQLIIDDIPEINKQLIEDSILQVEQGIASGVYPRNLKSCNSMYGKKCPYFDKCWNNDSRGLQIVSKDDIIKE